MTIQNSLDLLLALIYAPGASGDRGEAIKGITRLQKLFFLLWKEGGFDKQVSELEEFEAYDYGPFSSSLYDDLEFAESINLVKETRSEPEFTLENSDEEEFWRELSELEGVSKPTTKTRRDFELTEEGYELAQEIWSETEGPMREKIISIKTRYNSMAFMELIRYVYSKYPTFAKKSLMVI